jgi:hypothetical protein
MDNKNQDILFRLGIAVGVYFLVIKPILQKLGIEKTPEQVKDEEEKKQASTNLESPFSPRFWKEELAIKKEVKLLTTKAKTQFAAIIYAALNRGYLGDDVAAILGVFRQLKYKSQVSYLADFFEQKYQLDLYKTLDDGVRRLIDRFTPGNRTGLSSSEMSQILQIVKNLN